MYLSIGSKCYRNIAIRYWMPCGIVIQSNQRQTPCRALFSNFFRPTAGFTLSTTLTLARSDLYRSYAAFATSFKSLKTTFFGANQNSKRLFSEPPLKRKSGSSGSFSFFIIHYYIPKLVRALWLVNLAGRTLLHGPLKFKVFSLPNYCVIYHQIFSTYEANNSCLKLSL